MNKLLVIGVTNERRFQFSHFQILQLTSSIIKNMSVHFFNDNVAGIIISKIIIKQTTTIIIIMIIKNSNNNK